MKKLLLFVLSSYFLVITALAQQVVEKTLPVAPHQKIDLQLKFGDAIKVTAWDRKEVYIKVTYNINSGRLNNALKLNFTSETEGPRVTVDLDQDLLKGGKAEDCPDSYNKGNHYYNNVQQYFTCTQIDYEIKVPREGNLVVNTINGNIELREFTGSVNAKSISGFVDMSWPGKKGATVALKTITGEVYSNLDIDFTNKQKEIPMVGYQLKGNINGGGTEVKLETISNNVYFRKKE
ncbi:DUF4097 family beta strand repeat-containing protein [Adhaeribacter pallidiroseus]|uniref:Adhesin domain-containing protein n=1 Tax=Adhaeribacter pallidiroseus TaxID=2072847 RepID=A0A369QH38_9BACT|nr:hypothetical protein [Adhaeribacter pallidiroseus]RDC64044.1 hypothetical protein AHMF7616_02654 [Adhaeribacter pallidiroseus]